MVKCIRLEHSTKNVVSGQQHSEGVLVLLLLSFNVDVYH